MQTSGGGLKVHTSLPPGGQAAQPPDTGNGKRVKWRVRPRASGARALRARRPRIRQKRNLVKRKTTLSERLLRSTAVACALILSVMAFKNLDTPFTNRVTAAMQNIISMDIKLDESLGKLSFVQRLMPESALVFLNLAPPAARALPVEGAQVHAWSQAQPWLEFATNDAENVFSIKAGTLAAVAESESGDWTLLVNHADGSQAVYAYMAEVSASAGDALNKGDKLGKTGAGARARLYLEYREDGAPIDPAPILEGARD